MNHDQRKHSSRSQNYAKWQQKQKNSKLSLIKPPQTMTQKSITSTHQKRVTPKKLNNWKKIHENDILIAKTLENEKMNEENQ